MSIKGLAKPISINSLKSSDWILIQLLTTGQNFTGYSIIDKIFAHYLNEQYKEKINKLVQEIENNYSIRLTIKFECNENDIECISYANMLGVPINQDFNIYISIVAISSKLINWNRMGQLLNEKIGDILDSFYLWYGNSDELKLLIENLYEEAISNIHPQGIEEGSLIRDISLVRRAILIDENWGIKTIQF